VPRLIAAPAVQARLGQAPSCKFRPSGKRCPKCERAKAKADRRFLILEGGSRFHFPERQPKTLKFRIRDNDPNDQYARLYSDKVVDTVRILHLPRYGLANYLKPTPDKPPTQEEAEVMTNLSRAGKRLIGFCRTNLFKRLESSGHAFLLSVRRHIVRNYIFLHALENGLPLPVGHRIPLCSIPAPKTMTATAPSSARTRTRQQSQPKSLPSPWPILPKPEHRATKRSAPNTPAILIGCARTYLSKTLLNISGRTPNDFFPSSNSRANGMLTRITSCPNFTNF
jgi:hypothetical protein